MKVRSSKLGVATYLTPDEAVVEETIEALRDSVQEARAAGSTNVVFDLHLVPFMDSVGLEYLADLSTTLREEGGSLRLAGVTPAIKDVLAITRLDQTIPIYEDLESAGRSFL